MARYKKFEHLPWWLNNLNHRGLTPTEKEVLDLDYYCKKYGTKLSHQQAAKLLHRSRQRVYESRRRLEELRLRTTEPAKGSSKLGHPIEYQNEAEFLAQLEACGVSLRRLKNKRKSLRESLKTTPKRSLNSLSKVKELPAGKEQLTHPPDPPQGGSAVQGWADSPELRKAKDDCLWEVVYRGALSKLLEMEYPQDRAERLARIKADKLVGKRKAEREKTSHSRSTAKPIIGDIASKRGHRLKENRENVS